MGRGKYLGIHPVLLPLPRRTKVMVGTAKIKAKRPRRKTADLTGPVHVKAVIIVPRISFSVPHGAPSIPFLTSLVCCRFDTCPALHHHQRSTRIYGLPSGRQGRLKARERLRRHGIRLFMLLSRKGQWAARAVCDAKSSSISRAHVAPSERSSTYIVHKGNRARVVYRSRDKTFILDTSTINRTTLNRIYNCYGGREERYN